MILTDFPLFEVSISLSVHIKSWTEREKSGAMCLVWSRANGRWNDECRGHRESGWSGFVCARTNWDLSLGPDIRKTLFLCPTLTHSLSRHTQLNKDWMIQCIIRQNSSRAQEGRWKTGKITNHFMQAPFFFFCCESESEKIYRLNLRRVYPSLAARSCCVWWCCCHEAHYYGRKFHVTTT